MYDKFSYDTVKLKDILLDDRNPRIVTQKKLGNQQEILDYLIENGDVQDFTKQIISEGRNPGGERPYLVKKGKQYIVVEGNTRIATYKVLTGQMTPSPKSKFSFSKISDVIKEQLQTVQCTVAPSRDDLMPLMARAHFGLGDKSKWTYLGNRKALYDEWQAKKTIPHLSKVFERPEGQIREYIIEYMMYLKALELSWTEEERSVLTKPRLEFNPPIRFLQTSGHKGKVGVAYDMTNLKITFTGGDSVAKYQHLLRKLVVQPVRGLGATATYDEVFKDFKAPAASTKEQKGEPAKKSSDQPEADDGAAADSDGKQSTKSAKSKPYILFTYQDSGNDALIAQLMFEARQLNCKKLPACGTFLLRNILEAILKQIIHAQSANPADTLLDLQKCLNIAASAGLKLPKDDKKILQQFAKNHLSYVNLGAHGTVIPNYEALTSARDCVDQFVKRNI